ncbi:serine/threonine protein kinase [Natronincola peptidivorans]|uniref:Serine/threonine protein kinase n=1 Tax=Natronincola peptidivorans TaxID=426128 RepID=A0A1I0AI12_9FIRM|nr:protein kinase [Natronincola peptidivorans]SES93850.1 serine/threonine protein kinase [Natronincola peptidivorans]
MELPQLTPASVIEGRWSKNKYKIKKKIGKGGIAEVYLVEDIKTKKEYALKISKDSISINREYELLKKFNKIDIIVKCYEIDDYQIHGENYYYILLEYIEGENLKKYRQQKYLQKNTIIAIILIILKGIKTLYSEEYIITDLKLENIMMDKKNRQLKIIDLGGAVKKGETVKEFTPLYDRANWKCGERVAEASYGIFAVMMIFTKLLLKENIHPKKENIQDVINKIRGLGLGEEIEAYIIEGLLDQNKSVDYFLEGFKKLYRQEQGIQQQMRILLKEKRINYFLGFSIFSFCITIIILFLA